MHFACPHEYFKALLAPPSTLSASASCHASQGCFHAEYQRTGTTHFIISPRQVHALLVRELLVLTRNPADVAGRTLVFVWVALVVGLLFYSLPNYFESIR